jgi:hypothetical protein
MLQREQSLQNIWDIYTLKEINKFSTSQKVLPIINPELPSH